MAQERGLPGEEVLVDFLGGAGDLGELGAVGNEGGLDAEFLRDAVAVALDALLKLDLGLAEGNVVGIAARATGERFRVAGEAGADGGGEGREEARVAFAEVDALEDGGRGIALLGSFGDLEDEGVAADFERRGVDVPGLVFAPMPDGVEDTEAGAAEAFAAADAPIGIGGGRETGGAGLDLRTALLLEPIETAEFLEVAFEDVAEGREVPDIEGGVIEELRRNGALGPVGFLAGFVDSNAEVLFEEAGEADALAAEELGGEHRVEDAFRAETAEIVKEPEVKIAAVHHEVFLREHLEEGLDVQTRCEDIDEIDFAVDEELKEADPGLVVIHVVRLGIEEDLLHAGQRGEQRVEGTGLVEELIGGRTSGHFDAEQTANGQWKKTGNHASG